MAKTLMLTYQVYPQRSGQAIYSYALARKLCSYTSIALFSYAEREYAERNDPSLTVFSDVFLYPYEEKKTIRNFLCKMCVLNTIDQKLLADCSEYIARHGVSTVILDHIGMTAYFYPLRKRFRQLRFVYSSQNIESANIEQALKSEARNHHLRRTRAFLHKWAERNILKKADAVISISEQDTQYFQKVLRVRTPIYQSHPQYAFCAVKREEDVLHYGKKLLIVGAMNWYPNVSGTVQFVQDVFLKLVERDPEYQLFIVGKNPVEQIRRLQDLCPKNLTVTGFVDDMDDYYRACDVAIVPVYEGTGIKIKLIEALGKGMPVVSSAFAAKDYRITNQIAVAANAEEYLACFQHMEQSVEYRRQLYHGSAELYHSICEGDDALASVLA